MQQPTSNRRNTARRHHRLNTAAAVGRHAILPVERLESRQLLTAVTGFQVYNADTDQLAMTLANGGTIDYGALGTRNINLVAVTDDTTASVKLSLDGSSRVDSGAPHAWMPVVQGDGGTDFAAFTPELGRHTFAVTPYSGSGAAGQAGATRLVTFNVVDGGGSNTNGSGTGNSNSTGNTDGNPLPPASPLVIPTPTPKKPTVSLAINTALATAPATVTLTADAADADGSVQRVEFYRGTQKLGTDTTAPFTWSIPDLGRGTYSYIARAFDDTGMTQRSNIVSIKVSTLPVTPTPTPSPVPTPGATPTPTPTPFPPPPTPPTGSGKAPLVALVNPTSGTYAGPGYWALRADASDPDGTVERVDFVANGNVIASTTAEPFLAAWTNVAPGSYQVSAVAYDNTGRSATTAAVNVTVAQPTGGRTYYVSRSGSSGGSGSASSPINSINKAMSMASPGDTVLVLPGTYAEQITVSRSGTRDKPIVLKAEQPGTVIIDGGGNRSNLLAPQSTTSGDFIWVSGLTFRNANNGAGGYQAAVRTEDGWRFEDCTIEKVDGNGLGIFGDFVVVRNVIAQDNGVSGISGSSLDQCLLLDSVSRRNNTRVQTSEGGGGKITRSDGLLVDNLDVYDNNGPGFWFDIDNINCIVQNSSFHDNITLKKSDGSERITGRGLFLEISGVDSDGNGKVIDSGPLLVQNNLAYNNGSAGITVYATANAHLRGNTIVNDDVELKDKRPAPYSVHDLTIENNFFKNARIVADGSSASNYSSRHYVIDGNTYDDGGGSIFSWDAKRYTSPSSIFSAMGFEKNGRLATVNVTLPA
jgi:hypothetical protein